MEEGMTARKPCFECNDHEQDNMDIGECYESDLCTVKGGPCWYMKRGGHWEDCSSGAKSEEYPAWRYKQNMTQCPCCKGSGFIPKEGSIVDDIRALEWAEEFGVAWCAFCGESIEHGHADDCPLAAVLRRLK